MNAIWSICYPILALPGATWRALQRFAQNWWAARYR
jgi:hypothetical protein